MRGVCGQQEARAGARDAGSAQRRRAHEPTRPRPDNTRRAGDDARPGAAPAPHSPGRQALESALPRAAPPTDFAGDGVSTRPRALCRPRPPTGNPEATRGDRAQLQKGRIELGRALQAWSPVRLEGGTWVAPTHLLQHAKERGPRARTTLYPSWATCGWAPPESLRDFGSKWDPSSRSRVLPPPLPPASACCSRRFCRSFLRSALLVASSGSAASWLNQFRPLRCPESPLAGDVDFRGELGGRFPVRSFNLLSLPFPLRVSPPPSPKKRGPDGVTQKEWLVEVEHDGGTQSPNSLTELGSVCVGLRSGGGSGRFHTQPGPFRRAARSGRRGGVPQTPHSTGGMDTWSRGA